MALGQAASSVSKNAVVARQYGVDLISYECGQHLVGVNAVKENASVTQLFIDANGDPRMGLAYEQYLNDWKDNGGKLFIHFTHLG